MVRPLEVILIVQALAYGQSLFHRYPELTKLTLGKRDGGDPGKPLFLTPYISSSMIAEAQQLARVPFTEKLGIKSYAGYFTVNETYNSNQFLWYFPSMRNAASAPVIVWLEGGPGTSSLYGLFLGNGPIQVQNGTIQRRKYNWALSHHVIYIDNPVGAGFSFTKDPEGYLTDETQVGEQLYCTLTQFFKMFPKLQTNKFFVTGESYGGKYVPALAYTIHKKNPNAKTKINLKGLAIGDGLSDPEHQLVYSEYLYQIGLIDLNARKVFESYEAEIKNHIQKREWEKAFDTLDYLINGDMIDGKTYFYNVTGFNNYFNYLHTEDDSVDDYRSMLQKLQNSAFRKGIHVGDLPFNHGKQVEIRLKQDVMQSVAPWISELLDNYHCLIYNGQLDICVAYPLTLKYLQKLNFTGADQYKTAKRHIWRVGGEIAGYVKRAGKLVEVMVRNAGHMVPRDQPEWALDLITRFTHNKSFYDDDEI